MSAVLDAVKTLAVPVGTFAGAVMGFAATRRVNTATATKSAAEARQIDVRSAVDFAAQIADMALTSNRVLDELHQHKRWQAAALETARRHEEWDTLQDARVTALIAALDDAGIVHHAPDAGRPPRILPDPITTDHDHDQENR